MRAEAFECFAVQHFPVVRVGYADHEFCPLLEASAVEVHGAVLGHNPVCVRPRGYHSCPRLEHRYDLGGSLVGAGCECGDALASLRHACSLYELQLSAGAAEDACAYGIGADLAGKVVAVQLGTSGEALLSEGGDLADLAATFGDLMTCDSFLKCFTELGGAAVDAVIVDKPVAVSYAAENAGFTVLDEGLGAEQYGIAFRADDAELCKTIEGAVAQLVENGTYAEIAAKYPDIQNNLTLLG